MERALAVCDVIPARELASLAHACGTLRNVPKVQMLVRHRRIIQRYCPAAHCSENARAGPALGKRWQDRSSKVPDNHAKLLICGLNKRQCCMWTDACPSEPRLMPLMGLCRSWLAGWRQWQAS